MRSGTDETHVSDEDIRELGELVDIEPADKSPKRSDARIVFDLKERTVLALILCEEFLFFLLSTDSHRTEFVHREDFPILPYSLTLVEWIMSIAQTDHNSNNDEKWREDNKCHERANDIENSFEDSTPGTEPYTMNLDNGNLAEKGNLRIEFGGLKRVGNIAIPDAIDTGIFENLLEFLGREVCVHEEDFVDLLRANILDNLHIIPNIGESFICDLCHIGISDEIIDIRIDDLLSEVFLVRFYEEEDTSLCKHSPPEEGSDDTIHENPFDNNSSCSNDESKQDDKPWHLDRVEESEREVEKGNIDEEPIYGRQEYIENLLDLGLIDANLVES